MNITNRNDKNLLFISLEGRIDASNAHEAEEIIFSLKNENEGKQIILDADKLEYISSAGLRVILKLRKEKHDLEILNVSPDIYQIFDMTGFTDMVKIHKAYRRMSVEGCEFLAKGANGVVYRYDDETIVKVYVNSDSLPEILQERENARKAFVMGVNTAIPYDIVRVGDGYGSVSELLNAKSISKIIKENIDDLSQPVAYFVDMIKHIHTIEVEEGELPDFKNWVNQWVDYLCYILPAKKGDKLKYLISTLPESKVLIHGDYHPNNVMVQNGETLLIDMDTLSIGCPVLEFGSMYNAFAGFSEINHENVKNFLGIDFETSTKFWHMSLARYLETDDMEKIIEVENKAKIIGYTRILRRAIRVKESMETIEHYKRQLCDTIDKVDTLEL